jgi:hypothetical protein
VEEQRDPRRYFKFNSCSRCLHKPCDRLRFGGVYPGKFVLVHHSSLSTVFFDCPFTARDRDEIDSLLSLISAEDLMDRIEGVSQLLSPDELLHFRRYDFAKGACDAPGMASFITALWENQVIDVMRITQSFKNDALIRKWLFAYEGLEYLLKKPELENASKKAAVTDALADEQKGNLNNPRWEHKDADRAKASPDVAALGDTVLLMASAPGFADGADVAFDIFDASGGSPEKIETVGGKVDGGRAEAVWIVADPKKAGDKLDLQFEASAKDGSTEKAPIKTKFVFDILLQIDVDDPKAQDDVLILLDENNAEVKKLPVKDMKEVSEDIVRIVIEDLAMEKKYTLIRDYGAEDNGGHDPLFVQLTPRELMDFSEAPKAEDEGSEEGDEETTEEGKEDGAGTDDAEGAEISDTGNQDDDLDHEWAKVDSEDRIGEVGDNETDLGEKGDQGENTEPNTKEAGEGNDN